MSRSCTISINPASSREAWPGDARSSGWFAPSLPGMGVAAGVYLRITHEVGSAEK